MKSKTLSPTIGGLKRITLFLLLIPLCVVLLGTGCEKDETSQLDMIDFKIITMHENNIQTNVFEFGEDVVLAFEAINNSGEEIEIKLRSDYLACKLFQNEKDFMFVNKKSNNYDVDSSYTPIGKPYLTPVNCQTINLPYYTQIFPKGETILDSASWSSDPNNKKLAPGKYFTSFALTLNIEGHSKTWNLKADFEIKN
uniref:hypothetical protein n=1 Tax=uncultured Draconibacterium sp. TaxID=1573823 RepID=UPI003217BE1C